MFEGLGRRVASPKGLRVVGLVLGALGMSLVTACDRRAGTPNVGADPAQAAPTGSTISIAAALGDCDDLKACERECDAGSSDRCRRLGVTYEFGKGVAKDMLRATQLYEQACDMGASEGCLSAGRMYEYHHGVAKDDAKAVAYYTRACDLANATGCANLAIMLENGRGTPKDEARAATLYDQACARGAGLACERSRALKAKAAPDAGP
jgi:TPR repeat protein